MAWEQHSLGEGTPERVCETEHHFDFQVGFFFVVKLWWGEGLVVRSVSLTVKACLGDLQHDPDNIVHPVCGKGNLIETHSNNKTTKPHSSYFVVIEMVLSSLLGLEVLSVALATADTANSAPVRSARPRISLWTRRTRNSQCLSAEVGDSQAC